MKASVSFRSLEDRAVGASVRAYESYEAVREVVGQGVHGIELWHVQGPAEVRLDLHIVGDREVALLGSDARGRLVVAARFGNDPADVLCAGAVEATAERLEDGWLRARLTVSEAEACRYQLITVAFGAPEHEGQAGVGFDVRDISLDIGRPPAPRTTQPLSWQRVVTNEKAFGDNYKDLTVTLLRVQRGDTTLASVSSRMSRAGGKTYFELRPLDSNPILLPSAADWHTDEWGPLLRVPADTAGGQQLLTFAEQLSFEDRDLLSQLLDRLPDVVKGASDKTSDAKGWVRAASQIRRYLAPSVAG